MSNTNPAIAQFLNDRERRVDGYKRDLSLQGASYAWSEIAHRRGYMYNFEWMGRPVIQYPADIVGIQEVIWNTKPDLIIETGVAHGGSLIMYAGMQLMMGITNSRVVGVEIDLRAHNREAIINHPMADRISFVDGSSVAESSLQQVRAIASGHQRIMVILDSMHTHSHVADELSAYAPLVTLGNYLIVQDTHIEEMPDDMWADRPWKSGNSPMSASLQFLENNEEFALDVALEAKLQITCARNGWIKRVKPAK